MNPDGGPSGSRAANVGGSPSMEGGGLGLGEALALDSQLLASEQLRLDQCQQALLAAWDAVDRRAAAEIVGVKDGEVFPSLATAAGFRGKERVAAGAARGSGSRGAGRQEHTVGAGAASAAGGAPAAGAGGSPALDLRAVGAPVLGAFGASSAAGAVGPESGVVAEHADEDEVDMVDAGATDLADAGGGRSCRCGRSGVGLGYGGPFRGAILRWFPARGGSSGDVQGLQDLCGAWNGIRCASGSTSAVQGGLRLENGSPTIWSAAQV